MVQPGDWHGPHKQGSENRAGCVLMSAMPWKQGPQPPNEVAGAEGEQADKAPRDDVQAGHEG